MKLLIFLLFIISVPFSFSQSPVYPVRDSDINLGNPNGDVTWFSYTPVKKNGSSFEMYYTYNGIRSYATSITGTDWNFVSAVTAPSPESIIKKGSVWYLGYHKRYMDSVFFFTSTSYNGINFSAGTPMFTTGEDMSFFQNNDSFYCYIRPEAPREDPLRKIGLMRSSDFVNWTPLKTILWIDSSDYNDVNSPDFRKQYYNFSVFKNGNDWWGLANIYRVGDEGQDVEQNPPYEGDEQTIETQLLYSKDGINWMRTNNRQAFIPRSPGMMEIFGLPTVDNNTLWIYTIESERRHTNYDYENVNGRWFGIWRYSISLNDLNTWKPGTDINVTLAIEGQINQSGLHNSDDTVTVFLRNKFSPYSVIDSAKSVIRSNTLTGTFSMKNANSGSYFISVKSNNILETWSKNNVSVVKYQPLNYDFTTSSSQAYGDNMLLKYGKYCLYSGDMNRNGSIELSDIMYILNDVSSFITGDDNSDLNGDGFVDLYDMIFCVNNANLFIISEHP